MVTLKQRLKALAPGLAPRAVLEKLAAIQMIDVELPTTDGRTIVLSRHTEPEDDHRLLLQRLKLDLPPSPPKNYGFSSSLTCVRPHAPIVRLSASIPSAFNDLPAQNPRVGEVGLPDPEAVARFELT